VTKTDDAFVTVLNGEGAIPEVLRANYGRQQKQRSEERATDAPAVFPTVPNGARRRSGRSSNFLHSESTSRKRYHFAAVL
jgi:hypothetical protein